MDLIHRIRGIAGACILISLALAHWVHSNWLWFTAFIGINLLQSAFTHFCLMAILLRKLGWAGPANSDASSSCCCGK